MKNPELFSEDHEATYCPEDNKIRLYVGRVPREEYTALRSEGWTSTPKQDCDFVAVWSVDRKETAESYAGLIGDEDQSPQDRAADRAERFAGYLDKRLGEATGHADRYDEGPSAHGYQNKGKAARAAARHDRSAARAVDAWSKAEYWNRRTAGVISNALHKSRPDVRMRRIKKIEKELRSAEKGRAEYERDYARWQEVASETDAAKATACAQMIAGRTQDWKSYQHPRPESQSDYVKENGTSLYSLVTDSKDPITGHEAAELYLSRRLDPKSEEFAETGNARFIEHCKLRLAYENQMIEAQGGNAGEIEMKLGDLFDGHTICKINKSPATKRVTSVDVIVSHHCKIRWTVCNTGDVASIKTDETTSDRHSEATEESLQTLKDWKAKQKKAKAAAPAAPKLINPTDEDAEKLQAIWNRKNKRRAFYDGDKEVLRMTQAEYSARSKGSYSHYETAFLAEGGDKPKSKYGQELEDRLCKVRNAGYLANVVVITDKPQKPLPAEVLADPAEAREKEVKANIRELVRICSKMQSWNAEITEEESELFNTAYLAGYVYNDSQSQRGLTTKGDEYARESGAYNAEPKEEATQEKPKECPFKEGDQVEVKGPCECHIKGVVYAVDKTQTPGTYRVSVMDTWKGNDHAAKAYFPDPEWTIEKWSADEEREKRGKGIEDFKRQIVEKCPQHPEHKPTPETADFQMVDLEQLELSF